MENASLLAEDVQFEFYKTKHKKLLDSIKTHMDAEEYVYSRMLSEKEISTLLSNLKEDDLDLLRTLSFILSSQRRSDYYSIEDGEIVLLSRTPELKVELPEFELYEEYKLNNNKMTLKLEQEILKAKLNVLNTVLTMFEKFSEED